MHHCLTQLLEILNHTHISNESSTLSGIHCTSTGVDLEDDIVVSDKREVGGGSKRRSFDILPSNLAFRIPKHVFERLSIEPCSERSGTARIDAFSKRLDDMDVSDVELIGKCLGDPRIRSGRRSSSENRRVSEGRDLRGSSSSSSRRVEDLSTRIIRLNTRPKECPTNEITIAGKSDGNGIYAANDDLCGIDIVSCEISSFCSLNESCKGRPDGEFARSAVAGIESFSDELSDPGLSDFGIADFCALDAADESGSAFAKAALGVPSEPPCGHTKNSSGDSEDMKINRSTNSERDEVQNRQMHRQQQELQHV